MQLFFARTSTRKRGAAQFLLLRLTLALFVALSRLAWAGNYFHGVSPANVPWPGGIAPYVFDANYTITDAQKKAILSGLREWELAANVKFVPYTNQAKHVLLQFTNDGSGTGYYLSGSPTTNAILMLHGLSRVLICHEGGHLLGLQHEHQRIDRGNYIVVNTNNIYGGSSGEGGSSEFAIDSNSISFGPYDLESVMHYGPAAFTNGLGDSLDPLPQYEKYYHKIGNLALSIRDRAAVSNLYGATLTPSSNVVTSTADGGLGSLRAAIYYANDHPGTTIRFNIPASDPGYSNGVFTIYLLGELPPLVSAGTVVDAASQPGYGGHPVIALDGSQVPPEALAASGLHLYGTNCTIRALAFDNFSYAGLQLFCSDAASNHLEGCYFGLKPDGATAAPDNYAGVFFQFGAHDNFIGGPSAAQRNVISGNLYYGVLVNDTNSDGNVILGNYIGLDASGNFAVSNGYSGIGVYYDQRNTVIGGANAGAGNVISGNGQYGIYLAGTNNHGVVIQGNYIGTDCTGSYVVSNAFGGVGAFGGANSITVGSPSAAARNVISGNGVAGVYFSGVGCSNNVVQGNYLGANASGTAALPNGQVGVFLVGGASSTLVGGTTPGAGNLISGNRQYAVYISDPGTSNNAVQGNFIGTDVTGKIALGNGSIGIGVLSGARSNLIGGAVSGAGNVLSGNTNYGVICGAASANLIQGNLIGTDVTGTNALGNGSAGVGIFGASTGNLIGGDSSAARNVISGNASYGLIISDANTSNNFVQGNLIGADISGRKALANGFAGVAVFGAASRNLIGGTTSGTANVISGNTTYGVFISDATTSGNLVQGNVIGADAAGTNALGNGYANVEVQAGATDNSIGGIGAGAGNVIAFSGGPGVLIYDSSTTNNSVRGNSIFSNGTLGIDLNNDGVTPNHIGFLAGPNDFQNYPVITNALGSAVGTIVSGTLNSLANNNCLIDVYRNLAANTSGHGEGRFYVGTVSVTTDGSGNAAFALTNAAGNYAGQYFSTTATSSGGDTSEFAADVLAVNASAPSARFTGPFQTSANGFAFSLILQTNFSYRIQATVNLATNPIPWMDLSNFAPANSSLTFTDRTATNFPERFYRVVSP